MTYTHFAEIDSRIQKHEFVLKVVRAWELPSNMILWPSLDTADGRIFVWQDTLEVRLEVMA